MKILKIALGTTYEQKINYLKEVLDNLNVKAEIISVKVKSGISLQPLTSTETKKGSINRAKEALSKIDIADLGLGIEIGYEQNSQGKYEILCWVTIIDKKDNQISAQSHRFLLPKFHQEILKKKQFLGDYVRDYYKNNDDKIIQQLGEMIRNRKSFIISALYNALIHYLRREEF
ncbi:inosine/xanthosine triphosphatase [Patescibacteria group bacterium]|nr:inosine/xanthosine triphosphatase [Patescibacteria group bacterium]